MRKAYGVGGDVADAPDLAARIRERDPEAIQEVVRAYLPQILRAARGGGTGQRRDL